MPLPALFPKQPFSASFPARRRTQWHQPGSKTMFSHRVDAVTVWSYLLLGWMPIATVPSLLKVLPAVALWWMLIGGLCYTFGTLFLAHDDRHPLFHAVWHAFVIAGSTCHFMVILLFVATPS